jgi:hypothetical protein
MQIERHDGRVAVVQHPCEGRLAQRGAGDVPATLDELAFDEDLARPRVRPEAAEGEVNGRLQPGSRRTSTCIHV